MSTFWIFSQTLRPKVVPIENETHFCFTVPQIKIIAMELSTKVLNDSIIRVLEEKYKIQEKFIASQDSKLDNYQKKLGNQTKLINYQKEEINQAQINNEILEKSYVKYKSRSKVLSIGITVLAIILIVK